MSLTPIANKSSFKGKKQKTLMSVELIPESTVVPSFYPFSSMVERKPNPKNDGFNINSLKSCFKFGTDLRFYGIDCKHGGTLP